MKTFLRLFALLAVIAGPAEAATLQVTPGTGATLGQGVDGTGNLIGATILCGATATVTLYAVCVNQAIVNASGQILTLSTLTGTVPLPTGAATAANQEVTAAGTSAASAQGVQGVTGGVPMPTKTGPYVSAGASQFGISITSVTTLTVPGGTLIAEMCVETAAARYTDDGSTPSSSAGIPVPAGSCFQYAGPLASMKWIGAGATLDVSYLK